VARTLAFFRSAVDFGNHFALYGGVMKPEFASIALRALLRLTRP